MIDPLEITTILATYAKNGFIKVQPESISGGDLGYAVLRHPYGFRSRPRDPDKSGVGCDTLLMHEGDSKLHALLIDDIRVSQKLPDTGAGGSIQYAARADGNDFRISTIRMVGDAAIDGAKAGNVEIHVPYEQGQKTHKIDIDLAAGTITVKHGDGPAITLSDTTITLSAPGSITMDAPTVNQGGGGGAPVVIETGSLAAAFAQIQALFAQLGKSFTPPTGFTAQKTHAQ